MSDTILLTGATGNLGAPLLATLLKRDDVGTVVALVRASTPDKARERVNDALTVTDGNPPADFGESKLRVLCGDVTQPRLGLSLADYRWLSTHITSITHAAASTQFTLPIDAARQINCRGTREVLNLGRCAARAGQLRRIVHVSTAYVCGTRSGLIREDDSQSMPAFTNSYEQSKWETERMIRDQYADLPVTIARPTIVVGDSHSGRIVSCNVMYTPLRWIAQGRVTRFYCSPDTPLDVVSTDYVSDVLTYLLLNSSIDGQSTVHLCAGSKLSMTVGEIVEQVFRMATPRAGRNAQFAWFPESERPVGRPSPLNAYHPHMATRREFDTQRRESLIDRAGIVPRHLRDYLPTILKFCFDSDWRKRPVNFIGAESRIPRCAAS